jgi:hypothetical protein
MKDEPLEPLDSSLAELFVAEQRRDRAPRGSRERVLDRLAASIAARDSGDGGGGNGISDAAPSLRQGVRLWPIVGALVLGGAVGGAVVAVARPPRVVYVDRVVTVQRSIPAPSPASSPLATPGLSPSALPVASAPRLLSPPASSADVDAALARERSILDVARTALGRNDGPHAFEAVERHGREFPRGQMSEEREAIGVLALVKLGRKDDAAARGARFRKRYPSSVLLPVIDAALPPADAP